jgi:hypothetical protein
LFVLVVGEGQWPNAGVTVENVIAIELCRRNDPISFTKQIFNLLVGDGYVIEVTVITKVGRANQKIVVPGNDKKWTLITFCFHVDSSRRRVRKWTNNQMAAFGAAD